MLSELTISNLAIIERQSLSFVPGFNVISGETGAGKSIILNALEFILGAKLSPSAIRAGAECLEVQALFDLTQVPDHIRKELPEIVEGDELVVSRTLPREGRGKILVNGRLATVPLLEEIVKRLVNICSQHYHTRLLDPRYHLELLDGFAGLTDDAAEMRRLFREWQDRAHALESAANATSKEAARRIELEEIVDELSTAQVRDGRRLELESEIRRLGNCEKLIQLGQNAALQVSGEDGLMSQLRTIGVTIAEMDRLDPTMHEQAGKLEAAREALRELERGLETYVATLDLNEDRLEVLRTELSDLARLERKYRASDVELAKVLESSQRELAGYAASDDLRVLEQLAREANVLAKKHADALSKGRNRAAKELTKVVNRDLAEVNMGDARLEVVIDDAPLHSLGANRVQFLMSTNRGEPVKPLAEIASGGELSRVTLVLKKALRERSGVNVLIFDEVDTGISGGVARAVGRMLKELSRDSQVVCITHLPQVASLSDQHFLVRKEVADRAITVVRSLSDDEKVDEIARMLAGYKVAEASRASARELIASKQ